MNNLAIFESALASAYAELFQIEAYAYTAARHTPQSLASKMTLGLYHGSASKDGEGIKRACKAVGIKHTYTAITAFLSEGI